MLCGLVFEGLESCLRALDLDVGDEFDVVALGIDPDESVALAQRARLRTMDAYDRPASAPGWHFLVGEEADIAAVAGAVGFEYTYVRETDEYAHAAGLCLLTPGGELARIFYGTEFAPRDVKFGLMEASEGKIGTPIEKFVLRCFQYDPARGEYGLAIMGALRLGGIATVLVLAFFVVRTVRSDRRAGGSAPGAALTSARRGAPTS